MMHRHRLCHHHDGTPPVRLLRGDRGSLPMLMLVVLVGLALAALMVPLVITQTHTTTFDAGRGRALQAAESGIDLALGEIRASQSGTDGDGDVTKLPCNTLAGNAGPLERYSVKIAYYVNNPQGRDAGWLDANEMTCVEGYGVGDATSGIYIPSYVLLTSTGTDRRIGDSRTLRATYVVRTTDMYIPGGQIRLYPSGDINYCLTAEGDSITLQPCRDPVPDSQKFAYADQLGIELVTSQDGGQPQCLKTDGNSGKPLEMGPCGSQNQAPWIQMWGFDNDSHFRVSDPDQKSLSDNCFGALTPPTPEPPYAEVTLQPCSGDWQDTTQAWIPSPYVGSGGAGSSAGQLVDFYQFGRCLDVPDYQVNSAFLIAYGCMQVPNKKDAPVPPWNQIFLPSVEIPADAVPTESQWVVSCPSGGDGTCASNRTYCLTSPEGPGYATVKGCDSTDAAQRWIRYQTVDADGNALRYDDKYTIRPAGNTDRCLSLGGENDMYHDYYFKVTVETCNGSTKQKWNAEATVQDPMMANLHEVRPAAPAPPTGTG